MVEVANEQEALTWIDAGADVIQLEKCPPETVVAVVQLAAGRAVRIAAAGGVNAANAEAFARTGLSSVHALPDKCRLLQACCNFFEKHRNVATTVTKSKQVA